MKEVDVPRSVEEKFAFCSNSRRWLLFMDLFGRYPKTYPCQGDCDRCGYFTEREPTAYLKRKRRLVGFEE